MINYEAILRYKTSMVIFKNWLKREGINYEDFKLISMILADKHGLPSNSIFLENDLQFMRK